MISGSLNPFLELFGQLPGWPQVHPGYHDRVGHHGGDAVEDHVGVGEDQGGLTHQTVHIDIVCLEELPQEGIVRDGQ